MTDEKLTVIPLELEAWEIAPIRARAFDEAVGCVNLWWEKLSPCNRWSAIEDLKDAIHALKDNKCTEESTCPTSIKTTDDTTKTQ